MASHVDSQPEDESKRIRSHTEKAKKIYDEKVTDYLSKMQKAWDTVQRLMDTQNSFTKLEELKDLQKNLCFCYGEYRMLAREFVAYLEGIRTQDSCQELSDHRVNDQNKDIIVNEVFDKIESKITNLLLETRSSSSSLRSGKSKSSHSAATQAKAKARAALARMTLIEKEKDLRRKQVDIESDLKALKVKEIYEEAKAEAEVYEEEISEWHASQHGHSEKSVLNEQHQTTSSQIQLQVQSVEERTRQYVSSLPERSVQSSKDLNPAATEFTPRNVDTNVTFELSRFLLRKDLMFSRLTKYDDKPENYAVWKATFQSVVQELGVSYREEFDLLVKWLGPESARHAVSLRASSSSNPTNGVNRLWERLDERFGSPEIVEVALRKKIDNFPRIGPRDSRRLYDLADILDEILNNMDDPMYKDLLSYYNTSLGIIPIVNKLPHNLQEKWTSHAAKYKKDNCVQYPPFSYFTNFIREISKIRNDPGFMYELKQNAYTQPNRRMSSMKKGEGF
ncbi:uncharacterized protein LOC132724935 [Ruditapes philippinarum]|uniref:uncharacterized protein LOC132724935 n=1 Tax=Ruditapes philippinarum TaxID=129788 RepID=UPI00295A70A8|nr:uncharacterized protein LOC132724935 [Ruditapes philippinarum]